MMPRSPAICCLSGLVCVALVTARAEAQRGGELIERTLAIVGGQVITLSDVRAATTLGLVESDAGNAPIETAIERVTPRLVDRLLVLREVQRYSPPEPSDAAIDERVAAIRQRFADAAAFARALDRSGFSEARLRAWVRDDLRIAAYLLQRFAAAGLPTDDEVAAVFSQQRAEFEARNLSFEQAAPIIRERLAAERRAELIADWTADVRRRTPVIALWKVPD